MSGLEVVGLVAAIVAAYSGTAAFLIARKKHKENNGRRAIQEENKQKLEQVLALAPREIQNEYNWDFAKIGQRFAVGDSITRGQLSAILIMMQCDMIEKLQRMLLSDEHRQTSDFESLLRTSEVSRRDSISALAQQFQRFSVAAPIAKVIPGPLHSPTLPLRGPRNFHPASRMDSLVSNCIQFLLGPRALRSMAPQSTSLRNDNVSRGSKYTKKLRENPRNKNPAFPLLRKPMMHPDQKSPSPRSLDVQPRTSFDGTSSPVSNASDPQAVLPNTSPTSGDLRCHEPPAWPSILHHDPPRQNFNQTFDPPPVSLGQNTQMALQRAHSYSSNLSRDLNAVCLNIPDRHSPPLFDPATSSSRSIPYQPLPHAYPPVNLRLPSAWHRMKAGPGNHVKGGRGQSETRLVPFWECTKCFHVQQFTGLHQHWTDTKDMFGGIWTPTFLMQVSMRDIAPYGNAIGPKRPRLTTQSLCCGMCWSELRIQSWEMTWRDFFRYEYGMIVLGELYCCKGVKLGEEAPTAECGKCSDHAPHVFGRYHLPPDIYRMPS